MRRGDPIDDAANSTDADARLHGQVAEALGAAGIAIVSFNKQVGPNGSVSEIDIETGKAIIQVTTTPARKGRQIDKLMTDAQMNPDAKAVILYAPSYGAKAGQAILQKGAYVARSLEQLLNLTRRLEG